MPNSDLRKATYMEILMQAWSQSWLLLLLLWSWLKPCLQRSLLLHTHDIINYLPNRIGHRHRNRYDGGRRRRRCG